MKFYPSYWFSVGKIKLSSCYASCRPRQAVTAYLWSCKKSLNSQLKVKKNYFIIYYRWKVKTTGLRLPTWYSQLNWANHPSENSVFYFFRLCVGSLNSQNRCCEAWPTVYSFWNAHNVKFLFSYLKVHIKMNFCERIQSWFIIIIIIILFQSLNLTNWKRKYTSRI